MHIDVIPDMAELEIKRELVPNSCWDKNHQDRLQQLGEYYDPVL